MKFVNLLRIAGDEPLFESALLLAGNVQPGNVRRQLSRWVNSRRLIPLWRGLYALAPLFSGLSRTHFSSLIVWCALRMSVVNPRWHTIELKVNDSKVVHSFLYSRGSQGTDSVT